LKRETFNFMMNFFKNSYGMLITDERVLNYWELLKGYPDRHGKRVSFLCTSKYDYFPTPSQVIKELEFCDEDERGRYELGVKKKNLPINPKLGERWLRQTKLLLSCKVSIDPMRLGRLYTEDELKKLLVENKGNVKGLGEVVDQKENN